jgi:hypothetical protein
MIDLNPGQVRVSIVLFALKVASRDRSPAISGPLALYPFEADYAEIIGLA